ncbi:GTP pyrophosphokinase [Kribbella sp. CA-293567]|uniref:GTP pyrophosphokinase n=1 Tax=Kribbella sp. CA-293567 TaxID=3002436 RepID=UPI0022DE35B3|nr:hypothetical protein [Kribbella sp. CA-293567]WBQ01889.1 hypothetical protein OX958_18035 [Kribbella sp. CA-293567]
MAYEPARITFERLLAEQLAQQIGELDKHRIKVSSSRVKEPIRTWKKLQKPKYLCAGIDSLDDIERHIDDLVGVRIVCNNKSDIDAVRDLLFAFPSSTSSEPFGLAVEVDSEKEYVDNPKESGYRAYHLNLVTKVPCPTGLIDVRGELQVRTLLQDSWGDLTHEDTYKPGAPLPALVTTISRRLADLLATVDDLAQDLREELDRLAQSAVEDEIGGLDNNVAVLPMVAAPPGSEFALERDLILEETRKIVHSLNRPTPLATIASRLQATFGTGIRPNWLGWGSFKALLLAACPDVSIANYGPGYVIPAGSFPDKTWPEILLDNLP